MRGFMTITARAPSFKLRLNQTHAASRWIMFPSAKDRMASTLVDPDVLKRLVRRIETTASLSPRTATGACALGTVQHSVNMLCRKVLGIDNVQTKRLALANLVALPAQTQLLVAHCLERNNSVLMLLDDDADFPPLVLADWLTPLPYETRGVVCFKIRQPIWNALQSLQFGFLTPEMRSTLICYRKNKSAAYPWTW